VKRSLARKVTWLAGAGAFALAAMVMLFGQEILVRYHFLRLKNEPGYLLEILASAEGSPGRAAIERFLATRTGKEALFREYATLVLRPVFAKQEDYAESVFEALIWNNGNKASHVDRFPTVELSSYGAHLNSDCPERLEAINHLLPHLGGIEYRHSDYPDLHFQIVPGKNVRVAFRGHFRGGVPEWTCLLRRDPVSKVAVLTSLLKKPRNQRQLKYCLQALQKLGPEARAAVPAIEEILDAHPDEETILSAAEEALHKIRGAVGRPVEF
jgi:hypothetical protein